MSRLFSTILTVSILSSLVICPYPISSDDGAHPPIFIEGDDSFSMLDSGVIGGTGSEDDPYLIAGWRIETSHQNGIEIRNTTSSLVISEVSVTSHDKYGSGIKLYNASNVVISDCSVTAFRIGINSAFCTEITIARNRISHSQGDGMLLAYTSNASVMENEIEFSSGIGVYLLSCDRPSVRLNRVSVCGAEGIVLDNSPDASVLQNSVEDCEGSGVYLYMSSGALVSDNTLRRSRDGISAHHSEDCRLSLNNIAVMRFNGIFIQMTERMTISEQVVDVAHFGIRLRLCSDITMLSNTISQCSYGIFCQVSTDVTAVNNTLLNNLWDGLAVHGSAALYLSSNRIAGSLIGLLLNSSQEGEIRDNHIEGNIYGLYLESSLSFQIINNRFVGNYVQAYDDHGPENRWNGSYEEGGNYWSDYVGTDRYSGPMQDIPGSDGIGDTPYLIDADSIDHYPLMGKGSDLSDRDDDMSRSVLQVSLALIAALASSIFIHWLSGRIRGKKA